MPTPAPVMGATLARMRSTSANASVTRAKYEPFNPERKVSTDRGADQRAAGDPERERGPGVDAVAHLQDGSDIRAGPEEGRMTEGILPAIATKHVPALPHQRDQQCDDEKIEHGIGSGEQWHRREHSDDEHNVCDRRPPHARYPNRPLGRNSSTRMNMTKMPICPSDSPR